MTELENMSTKDLKDQLALSASTREKFDEDEDYVKLSRQTQIENFEHDFYNALALSKIDVKYVNLARI